MHMPMPENNQTQEMPNDQLAESTLLASLLNDPRNVNKALESVSHEAIYRASYRILYKAIGKMSETGEPIEIVTLSAFLKRNGVLEKCESDLYSLITESASSSDITPYCRIINDHYARRQAIISAQKLAQKAFKTDTQIDELISEAEQIYNRVNNDCERAGAKRHRRGRVIRIAEAKEAVVNYQNSYRARAVSTGWTEIDKHYRIAKGTLTVVTGIPGHGKSEWVDQLMINTARIHGWKWAIYSPENLSETMGHEVHIAKLAEKFMEKSFELDARKKDIEAAVDWLNDHLFFLHPDDYNTTPESLNKLFLELNEKVKIDAMVWDPWNRIEESIQPGESEKKYLFRQLGKLHGNAKRHGICHLIVAHPTKMDKDKSGKKYMVPTMYDIYGGSAWYDMIDAGISIYRNREDDSTDVHIQKVRFKAHGYPGMVMLKYNGYLNRFEAMDQKEDKKKKHAGFKDTDEQEELPF